MLCTESGVGIAPNMNIRLTTRCRSLALTVVGYWPRVTSEALCMESPTDPCRVFRTGAAWLAAAWAFSSALRKASSPAWSLVAMECG